VSDYLIFSGFPPTWKVREKSGTFVGGQGKIARLIRFCNCCSNIASGDRRDELFWIIWIGFLLFILSFLN